MHIAQSLLLDGFAIIEDVVNPGMVRRLSDELSRVADDDTVRRKEAVFGVRNVLDLVPAARELCRDRDIRSIVEAVLGPDCFAVRATLFNKAEGANWKLGWHRDRFIAVRDPVETAKGFHGWSLKADVWHVQPPESVLESMLAVRVHLDDCPPENGALRVIPGSHDGSVVEPDRSRAVTCAVRAGGILAMRPLLLHASSAAAVPWQRRVIHIEFAAADLPSGVEWYARLA